MVGQLGTESAVVISVQRMGESGVHVTLKSLGRKNCCGVDSLGAADVVTVGTGCCGAVVSMGATVNCTMLTGSESIGCSCFHMPGAKCRDGSAGAAIWGFCFPWVPALELALLESLALAVPTVPEGPAVLAVEPFGTDKVSSFGERCFLVSS